MDWMLIAWVAAGLMLAGVVKGATGLGYASCALPFLGAGIGLVAVPLVLPAYLLAAVAHVLVCSAIRARGRLVLFGPSLALGSILIVLIGLVGR